MFFWSGCHEEPGFSGTCSSSEVCRRCVGDQVFPFSPMIHSPTSLRSPFYLHSYPSVLLLFFSSGDLPSSRLLIHFNVPWQVSIPSRTLYDMSASCHLKGLDNFTRLQRKTPGDTKMWILEAEFRVLEQLRGTTKSPVQWRSPCGHLAFSTQVFLLSCAYTQILCVYEKHKLLTYWNKHMLCLQNTVV